MKLWGKPCPDCESKQTYLILKNKNLDGVVYSTKFIFCKVCEYEEEYREKKNNKTFKNEVFESEIII